MHTSLVGYTGFVGSNIYATGQIDLAYNSKNVEQAFGTNPELLIYAGLPAEKYLANHAPARDRAVILQAEENIKKINPKKLVLISTIDIFREPRNVDEHSVIETQGLHAYGYNRYMLELWVREKFPNVLIIRLPALFGRNLKKNFIYDYINVIPFMLNTSKYEELVSREKRLKEFYQLQDNGFYKVNVSEEEKIELKCIFKKLGFSALNFTDSRSVYQFYNLKRLWGDIQIALEKEIRVWHPATEPISAGEIYEYLTGEKFLNHLNAIPANYNYKTLYAREFGGTGDYILSKEQVLDEIKQFINERKL